MVFVLWYIVLMLKMVLICNSNIVILLLLFKYLSFVWEIYNVEIYNIRIGLCKFWLVLYVICLSLFV